MGGGGFGCGFSETDNSGPTSSSELATVDEKELPSSSESVSLDGVDDKHSSSSESVSLDGVDDKHSSSSESVTVDDKELVCYESTTILHTVKQQGYCNILPLYVF